MSLRLFISCAMLAMQLPGMAIGPSRLRMQQVEMQKGQFFLPELPYAYDSLEPEIDTATMQIHHQRHHQAYVDNLNKIIGSTVFAKCSLQGLFKQAEELPEAIRVNAGGHWNHSFFWSILIPPNEQVPMTQTLKVEIEKNFGTIENFREEFRKAGLSRVGSGWVWLIKTSDNMLKIVTTANQDNPLMSTQHEQGVPILACDIWEHAYYLKYQNRRSDYIDAFWFVINWQRVEELFFEKNSA